MLKHCVYAIVGLAMYAMFHLIVYSEPSLLIVFLGLYWACAELEKWDLSYLASGMILPLLAAAGETLL